MKIFYIPDTVFSQIERVLESKTINQKVLTSVIELAEILGFKELIEWLEIRKNKKLYYKWLLEGRGDEIKPESENLEVKEKKLEIPHENDVFFPKIEGFYRVICLYNGIAGKTCPDNESSLCKIKLNELPRDSYHEWDGKKAWKCHRD